MYGHMDKLGKHPEFPVRILANINSRSLGDFASSLFFVNSIADCFDHKIVTLIYRDDAEFKSKIVQLAKLNVQIKVPHTDLLPSFEIINCSSAIPPNSNFKNWYSSRLNEQHIVISEVMAAAYNLCMLERYAYLSFPDDLAQSCEAKLLSLGLKKDNWFCTLHCREPGYAGKPNEINFRDCNPEVFLAGANHVIDRLGGQVVRLGHPGMTPYPTRENYVDLSVFPDSSLLQAYAISRSRFMIGGPSGPAALAETFNVPLALVDMVDFCTIKYNDIVRTINVITPSGEVINQQRYLELGLSKLKVMGLVQTQGYKVGKNSSDTIVALTDRIFELSSDTLKWRVPTPISSVIRPNSFTWPRQGKHKFTFL